MKCFNQTTVALHWLVVVTIVLISSTVSIASAQSSNDKKLVEAFQAANANETGAMAAIGGKIIIVGACTQGSSPLQCVYYNTQLIPTAAPAQPANETGAMQP